MYCENFGFLLFNIKCGYISIEFFEEMVEFKSFLFGVGVG